MECVLRVVDNTGAKFVKCISVMKPTHCRYAKIGDMVKVSVRQVLNNKKLAKKEIYSALITTTRSVRHHIRQIE